MTKGKKLRFIALTAVALLVLSTVGASAATKIGTNQLKNNAVTSAKIKGSAVQSSDIKNGAVKSDDLKNGSIKAGDLASGSVTADKIAPGAVPFPNSLWGTMLRNQSGAAQSGLQAGPVGAPMGEGSLMLTVTGAADAAAFGDSFDFAGFQLQDISTFSYSSFNADDPPLVRPSFRLEIDPHLVADTDPGGAFEFTTLVFDPAPGATGWVTHTNALDENSWYLTGSEGTDTGCEQATKCTFDEVLAALHVPHEFVLAGFADDEFDRVDG